MTTKPPLLRGLRRSVVFRRRSHGLRRMARPRSQARIRSTSPPRKGRTMPIFIDSPSGGRPPKLKRTSCATRSSRRSPSLFGVGHRRGRQGRHRQGLRPAHARRPGLRADDVVAQPRDRAGRDPRGVRTARRSRRRMAARRRWRERDRRPRGHRPPVRGLGGRHAAACRPPPPRPRAAPPDAGQQGRAAVRRPARGSAARATSTTPSPTPCAGVASRSSISRSCWPRPWRSTA